MKKKKEVSFTNEFFENFRKDFAKAVEDLENKYNIKCSLGDIRYTINDFSVKMQVVKVSNGDEGKSVAELKWRNDFIKYHSAYELDEDCLDSYFELNDTKYLFLGCDPKRRKFPIVAKNLKTNKFVALKKEPFVDEVVTWLD